MGSYVGRLQDLMQQDFSKDPTGSYSILAEDVYQDPHTGYIEDLTGSYVGFL